MVAILNEMPRRATEVVPVNEPLTPKMNSLPLLRPLFASMLSAGLLLGTLCSCASSAKVKDEGSYTTSGKAATGSKGNKVSVGGSVGVYTGTVQ